MSALLIAAAREFALLRKMRLEHDAEIGPVAPDTILAVIPIIILATASGADLSPMRWRVPTQHPFLWPLRTADAVAKTLH